MIDRRQWLLGLGAALAAPLWIRDAFAYGPACPPAAKRHALLRDALARALSVGKPLLVLTVPPPASHESWVRGQAFGEWLNHGGDAALADLAQVEVVCATTADLMAVLPKLPPGEPLMRLVHDGKFTALDGKLDPPTSGKRGDDTPDEGPIDQHIALLSKLLRDALASSLTPHSGDGKVVSVLAAAARKRLVEQPVPGSHWARSSGCGDFIEGIPDDQQQMVDCGMGFTAARSQRFVYFYSCQSS